MESFKNNINIFVFIAIVLIFISFFEFYQNKFSEDRKEIRNYIHQHQGLNVLVGKISKLILKKSTYTNHRQVLEYLVLGESKNVYLTIYFIKEKNTEKIQVKKMILQNPLTGKIISDNFDVIDRNN